MNGDQIDAGDDGNDGDELTHVVTPGEREAAMAASRNGARASSNRPAKPPARDSDGTIIIAFAPTAVVTAKPQEDRTKLLQMPDARVLASAIASLQATPRRPPFVSPPLLAGTSAGPSARFSVPARTMAQVVPTIRTPRGDARGRSTAAILTVAIALLAVGAVGALRLRSSGRVAVREAPRDATLSALTIGDVAQRTTPPLTAPPSLSPPSPVARRRSAAGSSALQRDPRAIAAASTPLYKPKHALPSAAELDEIAVTPATRESAGEAAPASTRAENQKTLDSLGMEQFTLGGSNP